MVPLNYTQDTSFAGATFAIGRRSEIMRRAQTNKITYRFAHKTLSPFVRVSVCAVGELLKGNKGHGGWKICPRLLSGAEPKFLINESSPAVVAVSEVKCCRCEFCTSNWEEIASRSRHMESGCALLVLWAHRTWRVRLSTPPKMPTCGSAGDYNTNIMFRRSELCAICIGSHFPQTFQRCILKLISKHFKTLLIYILPAIVICDYSFKYCLLRINQGHSTPKRFKFKISRYT